VREGRKEGRERDRIKQGTLTEGKYTAQWTSSLR
jgi:hypothetical protein